MYNFAYVFVYISCAIKDTYNNRKNYKNANHILGRVSLFLAHFTRSISNVIYASINKHFIRVQNWFGSLSRLCQEKV
jgi:hypothetical protein